MAHLPTHFAVNTVMIESDNEYGCVEINESDFDAKVHKLYKEPKPKKEERVVSEEPAIEEEAPEEGDDLDDMTKVELREMAFNEYGVQMSANMSKPKMVAAIRDLRQAG